MRKIFENIKLWPEYPNTFRIAITAIMTALVMVSTIVITLSVPATNGYFNVGEGIIYISAILFGPIVGGVAGGVGAAIADLVVAPIYAPGTLIIKLIEGFIVGLLAYNINPIKNKKSWRILGVNLGAIFGLLTSFTGIFYLSDIWEIGIINLGFISVQVSSLVWIILGIVIGILIIIASLKLSPDTGFYVLIILIGGIIMVSGYFLYEWGLYNYASLIEVPVNLGQVIIGLIIAIPVSKTVKKSIPSLNTFHKENVN